MMMVMPPAIGGTLIVQGGRTYVGTPGTHVLMNDADAGVAGANGWTLLGKSAGTTAQRPVLTKSDKGYAYTDTTTGYQIIWDGAAWRNHATGGTV